MLDIVTRVHRQTRVLPRCCVERRVAALARKDGGMERDDACSGKQIPEVKSRNPGWVPRLIDAIQRTVLQAPPDSTVKVAECRMHGPSLLVRVGAKQPVRTGYEDPAIAIVDGHDKRIGAHEMFGKGEGIERARQDHLALAKLGFVGSLRRHRLNTLPCSTG